MKKKLLTLAFALVLLVGLVAAMGMNASAADQALKSYVDVNSWEDLYDFLQQAPGGFTAILTDDIVERNDSYGFEFPTISAAGTIVIDMNGHDIDIMSDATEYLFKVGGSSATKLHIVNTKDEGGNIILNSKYTGAHIIQVAQEASEVHLYAGVTLVMGTDGRYFNAHLDKTTAAINAVSFKTIGLHGANIENFMAYGFGINFSGLGNTQYANSNVVIEANSIIRSKNKGLYCFNNASVSPNVRLAGCTFDYQSSVPSGASEYTPKQNYQAFWFEKMDKDYGSILRFSSFSIQQADAANNSAAWTSVNKASVLGNTAGKKIKVTPSDCPHTGKQTLINYLADNGGQPSEAHFIVCATCGKYISNDFCTYVQAKPATCTEGAYSAGIDCQCGLSNIQKTGDKLGHDYRDAVTKKASLTSDGVIVNACTGCEDVQSAVSIIKIKSVTLSQTEYVHDGKNKTPKVTVKDANGNVLTKNVDYKTSVASKRSGIGRYTVKVTFIGNYEGSKNVYFTILPGKPASVKSASQTTSSIKLSWSAVSGAAGYTVYRYSPSKKAYVKAGTTEGTSLTVKKLYDGTKYTFRVVAYGKTSGGKVYDSASYALLKTATKTTTPELTKVTTTKGKATLTHTNVSGETGYTVYYSTKKDSGFKKYDNFKADTTTCSITGLTSGKTYYFKVRTYIKTDSGYVYSAWSTVKSVKVK